MKYWRLAITLVLVISSTLGCRLWICDANVRSYEQHAMLVHTNGSGILYPDEVQESWEDEEESSSGVKCNPRDHSKAFDIPEGESVLAACPGDDNKLRNFQESSLKLTCHNGELMHDQMEMDWSELKCLYNPKSHIKEDTSGKGCGAQQGYMYTIGWDIGDFFIPHIDICFNKDTETTLFTHHTLYGRYYDGKEVDSRRPNWIEDLFSAQEVDSIYKQANQKVVFNELLGSTEQVSKFWIENKIFLSRGHLSPDADFVTEAEQDATYYFANAVPQWNTFNSGNWQKLEESTRKLAEDGELTLSIWTGTQGILHLPDHWEEPVPIHLLGIKRKIPVPKLMWKVIYNPSENEGVVFIGLNNVGKYNNKDSNSNLRNSLSSIWNFGMRALRDATGFDRIPLDDVDDDGITNGSSPLLCKDICSELGWITWSKADRSNTAKGKIICCNLTDAKQIIPTLPDELDDISLLV